MCFLAGVLLVVDLLIPGWITEVQVLAIVRVLEVFTSRRLAATALGSVQIHPRVLLHPHLG